MNHLDPDMDPHGYPPTATGSAPGVDEPHPINMGNAYPASSHIDEPPRKIGRFQVDYLIGRGGMGEVYKARDPENNRTVAIKVLDVSGYDNPDTLRRLRREADSAMVLDHTNVARFYGIELDDKGHPVIVMEYIEGRGLDRVLEDTPNLPYSQVLDYIIQAARGLDSAYRRAIIHRDIKPDNIIITSDNQVKIIDFGLAKNMWENSKLTGDGMVVGTPRYISPEQGMGRSVDHRSDIYSLGATLYEMMTGQTPFDGDTPLAIMMKHINAPLMPPYMVNPRVPADISDIITRMMAKDPNERYQDYEPLVRDLESAKIHRLAKERRLPGQMSAMQTVALPEGTADGEYSTPNGYLTEGLVSVELPPDEPGPSYVKLMLLTLAGLAILGFAILFLNRPIDPESGERSTLGQNIAGIFQRARSNSAAAPATDAAQQDKDKIDITRGRMEAVVSKLLQLRSTGDITGTPRIGTLRAEGIFTQTQTTDAWGNDFYITDSTGGAILVAPGRDGYDDTEDDFRLSLDGTTQKIPDPIKSK